MQESARHQAEVDELKEKIENNTQQLKSLVESERAKAKVGCREILFPQYCCIYGEKSKVSSNSARKLSMMIYLTHFLCYYNKYFKKTNRSFCVLA